MDKDNHRTIVGMIGSGIPVGKLVEMVSRTAQGKSLLIEDHSYIEMEVEVYKNRAERRRQERLKNQSIYRKDK